MIPINRNGPYTDFNWIHLFDTKTSKTASDPQPTSSIVLDGDEGDCDCGTETEMDANMNADTDIDTEIDTDTDTETHTDTNGGHSTSMHHSGTWVSVSVPVILTSKLTVASTRHDQIYSAELSTLTSDHPPPATSTFNRPPKPTSTSTINAQPSIAMSTSTYTSTSTSAVVFTMGSMTIAQFSATGNVPRPSPNGDGLLGDLGLGLEGQAPSG